MAAHSSPSDSALSAVTLDGRQKKRAAGSATPAPTRTPCTTWRAGGRQAASASRIRAAAPIRRRKQRLRRWRRRERRQLGQSARSLPADRGRRSQQLTGGQAGRPSGSGASAERRTRVAACSGLQQATNDNRDGSGKLGKRSACPGQLHVPPPLPPPPPPLPPRSRALSRPAMPSSYRPSSLKRGAMRRAVATALGWQRVAQGGQAAQAPPDGAVAPQGRLQALVQLWGRLPCSHVRRIGLLLLGGPAPGSHCCARCSRAGASSPGTRSAKAASRALAVALKLSLSAS